MSVKKVVTVSVIIVFLIMASVVSSMQAARNTPVVRVIKEWGPSVVNISTERFVSLQYHPYWGRYGGIFGNMLDRYQGTVFGEVKLNGLGSGVIVSKDGLIVTNAHVVNMASRIYVILFDGKVKEASLEAINQKLDLALIKIDPPGGLRPYGLKPIRLAKKIIIGETVIAIGNPFGLQNSVSAGIVSGTNRSLSAAGSPGILTGLIQTDASINQGSSGGALINLNGELTGVSLAVVQNANNIGFAIPADKIRTAIEGYKEAKAKLPPGVR